MIVSETKTWLGTPWHHAARVKGAGVDCAMLIREVFVQVGLSPAFATWIYPEQWALHRGEEQFLQTLERFGRQTTETLPGNVIVFKFGRCYSHGGIIIEWPLIIHAFKPVRAVVYEDMSCSALRFRPHRFYEVNAWDGKEHLSALP